MGIKKRMGRDEQSVVVIMECLHRSKSHDPNMKVYGKLYMSGIMSVLGVSRSTASRIADYVATDCERNGRVLDIFWLEYDRKGRKVLRWDIRILRGYIRANRNWVMSKYERVLRENRGVVAFPPQTFSDMMYWLDRSE